MSAIILDQAIIHYEALGRGRPIVFLHSWVGSWRYWIASMQVASTSFRAYALDLYGYGDTTHNPLRYSLEHQSSLLTRFLDEMGIGKVALIGHGLGALVGFYFAIQQPQSVDRIMAVSCPLDLDTLHPRLKNATPADLVGWLSSRSPEASAALSDASKLDSRVIAASINGFRSDTLYRQFCQTHIPCLLVYGQNDPSLTPPALEYALDLPLHIHQINLEGSGHFPMLDESAKFHRLMNDFLALESGISPRELQLKDEWKRRVR